MPLDMGRPPALRLLDGPMRLLLPLLALACTPGGSSDKPPEVGVDSDPFGLDTDEHASDTDHAAPAAPNRPLCDEQANPAIPPDLVQWALDIHASENRFYGDLRMNELEAMGDDLGEDPNDIAANLIERGWNRLRVGRVDDAIVDLQQAVEVATTRAPRWRARARETLAITWVRRAELDNCVSDGTGAACLVPFSDEAVHARTEGMTNAAAILMDFLEEDDSTKLGPIWMLNVAHMALGDYPDAVDPRWRIDPSVLRPEREVEEWPNAMPALGFTAPTIAGSAAIDDFDGDGLLDLLKSSMEPEVGMQLLLSRGDGTFCDASEASGLSAVPGLLGFSTADYDNDGDLDIMAPRGAWMMKEGLIRLCLMRNDGEGRFVDVSEQAGLTTLYGPSQVSVWADFNLDGWLDVFVGRERVDPDIGPGDAPSSLYFNQRDGTFVDVAHDVGLRWLGFIKGAAAGDYDNDGDPDLYVSVLGGENRLFRNDIDAQTFVDAGQRQDIQRPLESFAASFFDYDQDGNLDIYCSAYPNTYAQEGVLSDQYGRSAEGYIADLMGLPTSAEYAHVYHNGAGEYEDATVALGLDDVHATMGANIGDFNLDGYPDMYLATGAPAFDALEPNTAYLNEGGARFLDVTAAMHTGHLQKGHGVAFGDIDDDGDEDLFANIGGAFPGDDFPEAMFMNPTTGHHSVTLRLEGVTANRYAVGARVRLITPSRTFHYLLNTGGSFGNNSHQIEAGLGAETVIEAIEIDWPAGPIESYAGVAVDQVVWIREGEGVVQTRPFAPMSVPLPDVGDHEMP